MNKELQNKVEEALKDIEFGLELNSHREISDDIHEIAGLVEDSDSSYLLSLEDHELYLKLSWLYMDKDPSRSEMFSKKALKLRKSYQGFVLKGNALFKMKDFKGAIGAYTDALDYKKGKHAYYYKAKALKKRGMDKRALELLSEAWKINKNPDIMVSYADSLFELGRVEEARKYYDRVDQKENTDHKQIKIKQLLDSAKEKSIPSTFDDILKLDENCIEAWLGKSESFWNLGEKEKAIEVLDKAVENINDEQIEERLAHYRSNLIEDIRCELCDGSGNCNRCEGSGNCDKCGGSGNCLACEGSGYCKNCGGSTECPECGGSGKSGWFSRCETCGGDGICIECQGHGMCEICDGTGNCDRCKGNGNCPDCQGSGKCPRCGGEGIIKGNKNY
ncbi:MAG: tetratricopeptide repeat protein [Candidatus Saliniplasma sp.]